MKKYTGIVTCLVLLASVQQANGMSKVKKFFGGGESKKTSGEGKSFEFVETSSLDDAGLSKSSDDQYVTSANKAIEAHRLEQADSATLRQRALDRYQTELESSKDEAWRPPSLAVPLRRPEAQEPPRPSIERRNSSIMETREVTAPEIAPEEQARTDQVRSKALSKAATQKEIDIFRAKSAQTRDSLIKNSKLITVDALKSLHPDDVVPVLRKLQDKNDKKGVQKFFDAISYAQKTSDPLATQFRNAYMQTTQKEISTSAKNIKTVKDSATAVKNIVQKIALIPEAIALASVKLTKADLRKLLPGFKSEATKAVDAKKEKTIEDWAYKNRNLIRASHMLGIGKQMDNFLLTRVQAKYKDSEKRVSEIEAEVREQLAHYAETRERKPQIDWQ